jgi:hypothetical protein
MIFTARIYLKKEKEMLSVLFSKTGLPVLLSLVAGVLNTIDNAQAREAAGVLAKVDEAMKAGQISTAQIEAANRHIEEMARMQSEEYRAALAEVNATLRAESSSADAYVRRMRPTFGYMMAFTWAAQMMAIAYVIVFNTEKAGVVIGAMNSLSMIWTVGLSVLGVYVYKRSEEKRSTEGREPIFWNKRVESSG